jgi:hypothetical protein
MVAFDSFIVGEDWISEHYFTTDATSESFQAEVLALRKEWDAEAKEGRSTVRQTLASSATEIATRLAELQESPTNAESAYALVREALGYRGELSTFASERGGAVVEVPHVWTTSGHDVVVLQAVPMEAIDDLFDPDLGLLIEVASEDGRPLPVVTKCVSAVFLCDEAPAYVLVQAGQWMLLAERERWAEGRYLAVDLALVAERRHEAKGGELDRTAAALSCPSLLPDAGGSIWWTTVLEKSIKHTVGVSQDLREGIRLSIEIIANDVVGRRAACGKPLDEIEGQKLARQSLRFLYRILFLLYAEASPEMGVVPVGAQEYSEGYGLDRLRDLTLVELSSHTAQVGTHLYDSLATLFRLVDDGHQIAVREADFEAEETVDDPAPGLPFDSIKADLFAPEATAWIDEVRLGNAAVQRVLEHLLLSKETKGKDRGFISYAELGINQLGAVYEGLMAYTGFFAETDLYEVAKDGDAVKGSWVVPVDRAGHLDAKDFVRVEDPLTMEMKPVLHEKGTFVFRLAGRERQQSASYYTPEVLTRFVVSQALEELLDQDGHETTADDILNLTICEPALGSGAFAIEAVRQLAGEYLKRKQTELDVLIPAENYAVELQKVKAQIALHQVYGVDLNDTAVELAEISLWLDTMVRGLQAPWFGLHLRRGNSLIGARRAVFTVKEIESKARLTSVPRDVPLSEMAEHLDDGAYAGPASGAVHHFLLPTSGWGSAADAKEVKDLAGVAQAALKSWRKTVVAKPNKTQTKRLVALGHRVETLWQFSLRRLQVAEMEIRREIPYFGKPVGVATVGAVSRQQIEAVLGDPNGAYQRLKRVMDAWAALWFWPLVDVEATPPELEQWLGGLEAVLGLHDIGKREKYGQGSFASSANWDELNTAEELDLSFAAATDIGVALKANPWLKVCERVAAEQGFLHWELDFGPVFAQGGFDLQVGNPPWVRPMFDEAALLAEGDPWWQLTLKPSQAAVLKMRASTLMVDGVADLLVSAAGDVSAVKSYLGDIKNYPRLGGLQPDLYRCFMERTWRTMSSRGAVGLIHPESHFTEKAAGHLRRETYSRLRRHWQFINEMQLFEVDHHVPYGVHIYGAHHQSPHFLMAASLYHPETVTRSLRHDGSGEVPGLKDPQGNWDLRPHEQRLLHVDEEMLKTWSEILDEPGTPFLQARMVYPVNDESAAVLKKLAVAPRVADVGFEYSAGWHEKGDRKKGFFESGSAVPATWDEVILQGPHIAVGTPLVKEPNPTMKNNLDWSEIDLEALPDDFIPRTSYQPAMSMSKYKAGYTRWGDDHEPASNFLRVAWRAMASTTGSRTLYPALLPSGPAHIHGIVSMGARSDRDIVHAAGVLESLPLDFLVKATNSSNLNRGFVERLPLPKRHVLDDALLLRALRLNCLVDSFAQLWESLFDPVWSSDTWAGGPRRDNREAIGAVGSCWSSAVPLRYAADRRQALVEIDAIVAIMLGVTSDELCVIYRTQFPVLHGYERSDLYDANGRKVPGAVARLFAGQGQSLNHADRTATNAAGNTYTYEFPFRSFDREVDMLLAHEHFSAVLAVREANATESIKVVQ